MRLRRRTVISQDEVTTALAIVAMLDPEKYRNGDSKALILKLKGAAERGDRTFLGDF